MKQKNYHLEEIKINHLMGKKHREGYRTLYYVEYFLIFIFAVSRCVTIFAFDSLVSAPVDIISSAVRLSNYKIIVRLE